MDEMEVMEVVVKYRVPRDELDEVILKLRNGARALPVARGFTCLDAFESGSPSDPSNAEIRALYKRT